MGNFNSILRSARPEIPEFKVIYERHHSAIPRSQWLDIPDTCNVCGSEHVRIAHHLEIYGKAYGHWPWAVLCDKCHSYVGLHKGTDIPMGTLAEADTRAARGTAKKLFIRFVQERDEWTWNNAYATLAYEMQLSRDECHFGRFTVAQANEAEDIVNRWILEEYLKS